MQFFGITLETRREKKETLLRIIDTLHIGNEEKDLYKISIDILNDDDFSHFFEKILSQIDTEANQQYSIEPLTSKII